MADLILSVPVSSGSGSAVVPEFCRVSQTEVNPPSGATFDAEVLDGGRVVWAVQRVSGRGYWTVPFTMNSGAVLNIRSGSDGDFLARFILA